jgi:glycopeptide antibiotics resistance protein
LFYFYIVAVIGVTLFPFPLQKEAVNPFLENNFIPFRSMIPTLLNGIHVFEAWGRFPPGIIKQLGGNILLLLPLGFFVPLIWKNKKSFLKALSIGFLFALGIEATQLIISAFLGFTYRIADVDDILLNCMGFVLGYSLFKLRRTKSLRNHP